MDEYQKARDDESRGSRAICSDCGTIYDPRRPWLHPIKECEQLQAWLDADSE